MITGFTMTAQSQEQLCTSFRHRANFSNHIETSLCKIKKSESIHIPQFLCNQIFTCKKMTLLKLNNGFKIEKRITAHQLVLVKLPLHPDAG